jgi:hypothetical protein
MEGKAKRLIYGIGSLFVAVIFIMSYAAFSNNGTNSSSTTTIGAANTVYVYGTANGLIVNYSYSAYISTAGGTPSSGLNATLSALEANGTISNFVPLNSTSYEAILSGMNPYQLYLYLSKALSGNVLVGGYAYVRLPATVSMYYSASSPVPVALPAKNYTVFLPRVAPVNSSVPMKINALITTAGTVYNNQIRLSEG